MKEALSQAGVKYAEQNIAESMTAIRRFLKLRDTRPEFDAMKEQGRVGLPCILVDDEQIFFELPENLDEWK